MDLDRDGVIETLHLVAEVSKLDPHLKGLNQDDFIWDDGQPWQVYIEEPTGEQTRIYSRFVQHGWVDVMAVQAAEGLNDPTNKKGIVDILILVRSGRKSIRGKVHVAGAGEGPDRP
ncbi:MAG: hypothetical protein HYY09_01665 [Firmicutes bacterium]|nr:hypothetical protein [Bacillota bacterium]